MSDLAAKLRDNAMWRDNKVAAAMREAADAIDHLCTALVAAKRGHTNCEDCWYSCPKSADGCCDDSQGDECNCGADNHNAAIDHAIAVVRENTPDPSGTAREAPSTSLGTLSGVGSQSAGQLPSETSK